MSGSIYYHSTSPEQSESVYVDGEESARVLRVRHYDNGRVTREQIVTRGDDVFMQMEGYPERRLDITARELADFARSIVPGGISAAEDIQLHLLLDTGRIGGLARERQ